jgi:hypothetical protein
MAGGRSGPTSIRRFRANEDGETGVGDAAEHGEANGGGAESRGSPEHHRRRAPTRVNGGQHGKATENEKEGETGLGDAHGHLECVYVLERVGGGWRRPEFSPERGCLRGESATVCSIEGLPKQFLVPRRRGRRGASAGALGTAGDGLQRRRHGEVGAVL